MGNMTSFPRTTGKPAQGYLAQAKDPKAPGVVVIQEWWGVQGQIKAICDRFAAAGFTALAPDLYEGKTVPYHDSAAAEAAMKALDFRAATHEAVRGAARFLKARGGKVGITGFCMGGAVAIVAAVHVPELDAAVAFYGLPPESVAAAKDVRIPLQGHFASTDDWVTPAALADFEGKLKAAGKKYEFYRCEGHHAFMNSDRREVYSEAAAKLAWERCLAFFREHLR
ncbi:MAG TPA: dienelactone hydrolase family protein [Anaeromyxobacteraceae bacterium]|nr:dienelactone hydrolase family protein [Anaeromyxobacteraceae bacterium]